MPDSEELFSDVFHRYLGLQLAVRRCEGLDGTSRSWFLSFGCSP